MSLDVITTSILLAPLVGLALFATWCRTAGSEPAQLPQMQQAAEYTANVLTMPAMPSATLLVDQHGQPIRLDPHRPIITQMYELVAAGVIPEPAPATEPQPAPTTDDA